MNKISKILIVAALLAAVGIVVAIKQNKTNLPSQFSNDSTANTSVVIESNKTETVKPMPRLVDLGAGKCIPCKKMAPILEKLKVEYADTFKVDFIDVWENPDEAKKYGIKLIPTQIFYDASGKELFRHEGFFSREDILAKWQEFGVNIDKK
ncbi:MAG: thioredoxin family protein [Planctomycetota bacterium]|jgi:thioredoxin 1